jgi:hypothetical protein
MLPGALILMFVNDAGSMLLFGHSRKLSYNPDNPESTAEGDMASYTVSPVLIEETVNLLFRFITFLLKGG